MSQILSQNNPVSVRIGNLTYENVVSVGVKVQGVGGGDMVSSQTVANNFAPVALTDHAKETVVVVAIDARNVLSDLISAGYISLSGSNGALGTFSYVERNGNEQTRTVNFDGSKSKIQSCEPKLKDKENPVTEITILTSGNITFSNFT